MGVCCCCAVDAGVSRQGGGCSKRKACILCVSLVNLDRPKLLCMFRISWEGSRIGTLIQQGRLRVCRGRVDGTPPPPPRWPACQRPPNPSLLKGGMGGDCSAQSRRVSLFLEGVIHVLSSHKPWEKGQPEQTLCSMSPSAVLQCGPTLSPAHHGRETSSLGAGFSLL